ncbi:MAG: ATP-binding cassette domain-containing protein [Prevotella sp.]|nr:ATP-binding cassette domain-containing protein [Prevotella sp.]
MLSVKELTKTYRTGKSKTKNIVTALDHVSIDFPETGLVFLLGKSGSGKSTLLNSIGGLDGFDAGEIIIKGKSSQDFTQSDFDSYRNTFIGFIFQEYNILEEFTVAKNLALAIELQGKKPDKKAINDLLEQVDMLQYANRKPNQLSGGQKQRVAIARALIKNPEIIMADEPTGALDSNTGRQVMETLKHLSQTKLVIIVSHDREFAELYGDRIVELKDGHVIRDVTKKAVPATKINEGVSVIDDKLIHIKQGQKLSAKDCQLVMEKIQANADKGDTLISLDAEANRTIKKTQNITDNGDKEAFLTTQKDDIQTKTYGSHDLRLIKSRFKFTDSFKMGASSLKNKVGKLIFTILLSFFAFTVFGVVDTLSCWNRPQSVAEAVEKSGQTNVVFQMKYLRDTDGYAYWDTDSTPLSMLKELQDKFPQHNIKGVVGSARYSYQTLSNFTLNDDPFYLDSNNSDPLYSAKISGAMTLTDAERESLGFTLVKGHLPTAAHEICISQYTFNALKQLTKDNATKITDDNLLDLQVYLYSQNVHIVGVIDDHTDYSKYTQMSEQERMSSSNQYTIDEYFSKSLMRVVYVNETLYESLLTANNASSSFDVDVQYDGESGYLYIYADQGLDLQAAYQSYNDNIYNHYDGDGYKFIYQDYTLKKYSYSDTQWTMYQGDKAVYRFDESKYYYLEDSGYQYGYYLEDLENNVKYYGEDEVNQKLNDLGFGTIQSYEFYYVPANFKLAPLTVTQFFDEYLVYYQGGIENLQVDEYTLKPLADDEIILQESTLSSWLGTNWRNRLDEGFTIDLKLGYRDLGTFKVVGARDYGGVYLSTAAAQKIMAARQGVGMFVAHLQGDSSDADLIKYCETERDGIKFVVQNETTTILDMLEEIILSVAKIFMYIAIAFAVFAALMLMNFIATSIAYKKREIGVLRALGARGSDVFGIFLNEGILIALINFVLAAAATLIGCSILNNTLIAQMGMNIVLLSPGIRQIALILAVSVGSAFLACLLPVFKIARKKPVDAIQNR